MACCKQGNVSPGSGKGHLAHGNGSFERRVQRAYVHVGSVEGNHGGACCHPSTWKGEGRKVTNTPQQESGGEGWEPLPGTAASAGWPPGKQLGGYMSAPSPPAPHLPLTGRTRQEVRACRHLQGRRQVEKAGFGGQREAIRPQARTTRPGFQEARLSLDAEMKLGRKWGCNDSTGFLEGAIQWLLPRGSQTFFLIQFIRQ